MVYFVCETCNETLKKAQVEKHVYSCRNCWGVTCVDCNYTFEGESYREHTSCVSEDQKYQGALFKAPKTKTKNRGVNEIWTDAVMRAAEAAAKGTAPKAISSHLARMGDLGNVPRQEKKFKNFVKNSLRIYDDVTASKIWIFLDGIKNDIIKEEKGASEDPAAAAATTTSIQETAPSTNTPSADRQPSDTPAKGSAKKGKKRRRGSEPDEAVGINGHSAADDAATASSATAEDDVGKSAAKKGKVEAEDGRPAVDATCRKLLGKAAIGILKKAPKAELPVKQLVKRAVVAAREKGGKTAELDQKVLKQALRKRLKDGKLKKVTVTDDVAVYGG